MHPSIANPAPGLVVPTAPAIAAPDGVWNHGEGFGANAIDHGGWHGNTDGTNLTAADVHVSVNPITTNPWVAYTWQSDPDNLHPKTGHQMLRMEGWLRPAGIALPTTHPMYGALGQPYVDQGAFEMFKPITGWTTGQRILVVVHTQSTVPFPRFNDFRTYAWTHIYRGYFSPDGLVRYQPTGPFTAGTFLGNDDDDAVERPFLNTIPYWGTGAGASFWPIEAYPVLTVEFRSTTLNEQRYLQIAQAVRVLLQQSDLRNPVGAQNALTAQQVDDLVDVVFVGGSNGGLNSSFAMLRYPRLVHGAYAEVINPSYQRLYAEHDRDRALRQLTGAGVGSAAVAERDFLIWNQYVWSQGIEMHDNSLLRLFLKGKTHRPSCFVVGDEDVTSTGVNWARVLHGSTWATDGIAPAVSGSPWNTCGWAIGSNWRHSGYIGPLRNPYTGVNTWHVRDVAVDWAAEARLARVAQVASGQQPPAAPLNHTPRLPGQQLRGLDDPQEWWLGRLGDPLPASVSGDPLVLDTQWVDTVNPGATGAVPGGKEAMFVRDNRVYVGSADGFVTSFVVDTGNPKLPLVKHARSPRLGHECFAIAPVDDSSGSWLVAGTRRHLHRLARNNLTVSQTRELPFEVAQPRHIVCADVLPGHTGPEIVFPTVHGGLCFYDLSLQPLYEWTEPGIQDFFVLGSTVTILSARFVLANVTFAQAGSSWHATLTAISRAIPRPGPTPGTWQDPPSMGGSREMELMRVNWTGIGMGYHLAPVSLWSGDQDCLHSPAPGAVEAGSSVRGHEGTTLAGVPYLPGIPASVDIAACTEGVPLASDPAFVGDHLLVLTTTNRLLLYDQFGSKLGEKNLGRSQQGGGLLGQGEYTFGTQARWLAVGELVANSAEYTQEVVIATESGLMWMHVQEVKDPGTVLPATGNAATGAFGSGFWVEQNRGLATPLPSTHIQARTNQALPMTWAMSRRPAASGGGNDSYLHVLDQLGNYWKVGHSGPPQLWDAEPLPLVRGWDYVGAVGPDALNPLPSTTELEFVAGGVLAANNVLTSFPHCPIKTYEVYLEKSGGAFVQNNWERRRSPLLVLDGFALHSFGGTLSPGNTGNRELWRWSTPASDGGGGPWANLVEGIRIKPSGAINEIWASTHIPTGSGPKCDYLELRSNESSILELGAQAIQVVEMTIGGTPQTFVVLGCPGGRVRVFQPGQWQTPSQVHTLPSSVPSSDDLGHGGMALATQVVGSPPEQSLRIWLGTIEHPDKRPVDYGNDGGTLRDDEVSSGAIHRLTWAPGQSSPTVVVSTTLHPTSFRPRGASAVVGLLVTDLLASYGGDEVIAGTLSGDIIVYDADTLVERWRTHVHGSAGCFNSIRAEDLDGDGLKELYVAGSFGLWRFTQPGENP